MYPYDLPINLPIADKMTIGEREPEELEWLLEHGELRSEILWKYKKLLRPVPGVYQLWEGTPRDDPIEKNEEFLIGTFTTIPHVERPYAYWYWFAASPCDMFPYIRQRYHLPFLRKYLPVMCHGRKGIIARAENAYILVYHPESDLLLRYHPTWNMVYYDDEGKILADYREKEKYS